MAEIQSIPTALYRLYDIHDELLYVGITTDTVQRWKQHARERYWWPEVTRWTIEEHPDRLSAESAEMFAIKLETPRHNVIHSILRSSVFRSTVPKSFRFPPDLWYAAHVKAVRERTTITAVLTDALREYVGSERT